jgi:dienelactone hydrolase
MRDRPRDGEQIVHVLVHTAVLEGTLAIPFGARGIVVFAHGSGSSRHSPRNRFVAHTLRQVGLATLLVDLLTADEEETDFASLQYRFDIPLLADRLVGIIEWLAEEPERARLSIGLFGSSTGAAAALIAAAERPEQVAAVVSRGGRVDLAEHELGRVRAPTLMLVGSLDKPVLKLNEQAAQALKAPWKLVIIPAASHLFEEAGALAEVANRAAQWFTQHLVDTAVSAHV